MEEILTLPLDDPWELNILKVKTWLREKYPNIDKIKTPYNKGKAVYGIMKACRGSCNPAMMNKALDEVIDENISNDILKNWNKHLVVSAQQNVNINSLYDYVISELYYSSEIIKAKLSKIFTKHIDFITKSYSCAIYGNYCGAQNDLHSNNNKELIFILIEIWTDILNQDIKDSPILEQYASQYF